jgi:hypothetical protein
MWACVLPHNIGFQEPGYLDDPPAWRFTDDPMAARNGSAVSKNNRYG